MKLFIIIFLNLIFNIFSILPIWNLKSSSTDLLGSESNAEHEYIIANRFMYQLTLTLKKKITRNNGDISHQNYLTINEITTISNKTVTYENVESFYGTSNSDNPNIYILCPRGKFNPIDLSDANSNNHADISFDSWITSENWDLK